MQSLSDVILASGSPRRRSILAAAGVGFSVMVPVIDDALLPADGEDPARLVMALAWFKARQVDRDCAALTAPGPRWVVAADTMCFDGATPVGKPADAADARRIVARFEGRSHEVLTGLCVLDRRTGARRILSDAARVWLGALPPGELDAYVASGDWRGKAGGYNFADRVDAGWPLRCEGDPETVMGLPSRLVLPLLRAQEAA